jgi:hypothetical protein
MGNCSVNHTCARRHPSSKNVLLQDGFIVINTCNENIHKKTDRPALPTPNDPQYYLQKRILVGHQLNIFNVSPSSITSTDMVYRLKSRLIYTHW